jgi:hypothetical protein
MAKAEYKRRLQDTVDDMMAAGADQDQLLNALTECTLDFMADTRTEHDKRAASSEKRRAKS